MNKRIILTVVSVFLVILVFSGCANQQLLSRKVVKNVSQTPNTEEIESADFMPILFYDGERNNAFILTSIQNKQLIDMSHYTYRGSKWEIFTSGKLSKVVNIQSMPTGQKVEFYNSQQKKSTLATKEVFCSGRAIDEFAEVYVELNNPSILTDDYWLGCLPTQNLYPQSPKYYDDGIEVDLDNNGVIDKITINYQTSTLNSHASSVDYFDASVLINVNSKEYTFHTTKDLPVEKNDLKVFVADLNGDGCMEILIYEKALSLMSEIFVYQIDNEMLSLRLAYTINPGP